MKKFLLTFFLLIFVKQAFAVNIQQFRFGHDLTYATMQGAKLDNSFVKNDYKFLFEMAFHHVTEPLILKDVETNQQIETLVDSFTATTFGLSFAFSKTMSLGLSTSFNQVKISGFNILTGEENVSASTLADTDLELNMRVFGGENYAVSFIPMFRLATGDPDYWLSDESNGFGGVVAGEYRFNNFQVAVNVGYFSSPDAIYSPIGSQFAFDLDYRQKLLTAIGGYMGINDTWGLNVEYQRYWTLPFNNNINPNELYFGLHGQIAKSANLYGGLSVGNVGKLDSNDFRGSLGVKFFFGQEEATQKRSKRRTRKRRRKRREPIVIAKSRPRPKAKRPIRSRREEDSFDDELSDEDLSLFDDIEEERPKKRPKKRPRAIKAKPRRKSSKRNRTRVAKKKASTPSVSSEKEFGLVVWNKNVYFGTNSSKITKNSEQLLNELLKYIRKYKKRINKVVIEGHASRQGSASHNLKLSKKRSTNIYNWLTRRGVSPRSLKVVYYGYNRPNNLSATNLDLESNRRVEFRVYMDDNSP